ncbi:NAD-dependent epimerase/dehydratase family protein [Ramlibacter sp. AN1133]|uniref:NAD-dependent epimerase/dehydratase family protein n=1 Tax=Ramlibacter sp. AN1133 TaxID=3133429 RepID=UPI0030C4378D
MARLLIAGATGLVGTQLVRQARAAGHEVTRICRAETPGDVRTVVADLRHPYDLAERLPREAFDAVLYLAQGDDHNDFPANASNAVALNIAAPVALCQWAVHAGCGRFLFASSGGIFGSQPDPAVRITEATPPAGRGLSFYLSTKARCEELLRHFEPHIPLVVLRYFFVYGAGQRPRFLLPRLAQRIRLGETIELAGGRGALLNPIHADDAAGLTLAAALGDAGGSINIAGVQDTSVADLAALLAACLRVPLLARETPGAPACYLADTSRMRGTLGSPRVALEDGIRRSFGAGEASA